MTMRSTSLTTTSASAQARPGQRPWPHLYAPPAPVARPGDTLKWVRQGYCAAVLVSAVLQCVAFWGEENNFLCTLIATVSSIAGLQYALDSQRLRFQPISALILLFFTTTSTSAALIVKTVEWTPLVDRLQVPLTTFTVLFGAQLVLIATDLAYTRISWLRAAPTWLASRVYRPIGLMGWPTDAQFWVLGALGCASVVLTGTDYESGASFGIASAGEKVIRAFQFLKFAPFLIPFRHALSGLASPKRPSVLPLAAYFAMLVVVSFATNSRSTFADAVPTVGICALVALGFGRIDLSKVTPVRVVFYGVVALALSLLLSRVALAMVVVRDYRYNIDVGMLINMTFEALTNQEWLDAAKAKMDTSVNIGNYSETYVDSRFAARFLLTKFHDNIFYYFSLFGPDHIAAYREFMLDRLLATLPDPFLRKLGIFINKEDLVVSNGDYIIYMIDGWGLGGFKTGSMMAEVYAVFGGWSPLVLAGNALLLFVFHDAFVDRRPSGLKVVSPLILLLIWNLCGTTAAFGLGAESVTAIPAGIVRGLPQNILIYSLALWLVKPVARWGRPRAGLGR